MSASTIPQRIFRMLLRNGQNNIPSSPAGKVITGVLEADVKTITNDPVIPTSPSPRDLPLMNSQTNAQNKVAPKVPAGMGPTKEP